MTNACGRGRPLRRSGPAGTRGHLGSGSACPADDPALALVGDLSLVEARRFALAAQGFDRPRPRGRVTARHLARTIRQLGLPQVDGVNVVVARPLPGALLAPRALRPPAARRALLQGRVHRAARARGLDLPGRDLAGRRRPGWASTRPLCAAARGWRGAWRPSSTRTEGSVDTILTNRCSATSFHKERACIQAVLGVSL